MNKLAPSLIAIAVFMPACASSAPSLRPIDKGDAVERYIALQDNFASIIERSRNAAEGAVALEDYCAKNRAAIDEASAEMYRRIESEDPNDRKRLNESTDRLVERMGRAAERQGWADGDERLGAAMATCIRMPGEPTSSEPEAGGSGADDESPLGVPACDRYIAKFIVCSADMPADARPATQAAITEMRTSWREIAKADPEALASGCVSALAAARETMGAICPGVVWE